MPCVYDWSLATAGNLTTNGSANTESDAVFVKAGSARSVGLKRVDAVGKAAGLTALSAIALRIIKLATASTSGTGITPSPCDPGFQAAKCTMASAPTIGSTRTNRGVFGFSCAGANMYQPGPDQDSTVINEAGAASSIDIVSVSGTVSLNYELSGQVQE